MYGRSFILTTLSVEVDVHLTLALTQIKGYSVISFIKVFHSFKTHCFHST